MGVVGCVLAPSCGTGSGEDAGPLAFGGAVGELCLPATAAGQYTFGFDTVANRSPRSDLRIDRVGLVESRGITLREAYVMDIANTTLIGTDTRWPPSAATGSPVWETRVAAQGAVLPPGGKPPKNLVLHLQADGATRGFQAVSIRYTVDGKRYVHATKVAVVVRAKC